MRRLTTYEVRILIENEIEKMHKVLVEHTSVPIEEFKARCKFILKYCEEYEESNKHEELE